MNKNKKIKTELANQQQKKRKMNIILKKPTSSLLAARSLFSPQTLGAIAMAHPRILAAHVSPQALRALSTAPPRILGGHVSPHHKPSVPSRRPPLVFSPAMVRFLVLETTTELMMIILVSMSYPTEFEIAPPTNWGMRIIVSEGTAYIVERFGKYHKTLTPGLHMPVPLADRVATHHFMPKRIGRFNFTPDICNSQSLRTVSSKS